jgi:hypothetical protein
MSEEGVPIRPAGRWVSVRLQHRRVSFEDPEPEPGFPDDADEQSLSYSGIVITSYDHGAKVAERWIPLGVDPSEADDERLIEQLREALLWQAGRPPQAAGE